MKRQDYIKLHASELKKLCDKKDRLRDSLMKDNLSEKRRSVINVDLNFTCMHIAQEEERILFALGRLAPEEARKEYQPTPIQIYEGIGRELMTTKFDN